MILGDNTLAGPTLADNEQTVGVAAPLTPDITWSDLSAIKMKHRDESFDAEVDFSERLDGDALQRLVDLKILEGGKDVTSEFGIDTTPQRTGNKVEFSLQKASGSDQNIGFYTVKVVAETTEGDTVVARSGDRLPYLRVIDD